MKTSCSVPPNWYPVFFLATILLVWLVPFFWSGWTGRAWSVFPRPVSFQHTAAGLFTRTSTKWWDHHLEGQDYRDKRFEIDETKVFPMGAFGFRTRYDRILNESQRSAFAGKIRQRLAEHVYQKYRTQSKLQKDEGQVPLKAIRLIRSVWTVGSPDMKNPPGEWSPPNVVDIKGSNRLILGTYKIDSQKVVEVRTSREGNPRAPASINGRAPVVTAINPRQMIPRTRSDGAQPGRISTAPRNPTTRIKSYPAPSHPKPGTAPSPGPQGNDRNPTLRPPPMPRLPAARFPRSMSSTSAKPPQVPSVLRQPPPVSMARTGTGHVPRQVPATAGVSLPAQPSPKAVDATEPVPNGKESGTPTSPPAQADAKPVPAVQEPAN